MSSTLHLRSSITSACMLAIVLATLVALSSLLQPQTASAQGACGTSSYGCGSNPYGSGFGSTGYNGYNSGYNGYNNGYNSGYNNGYNSGYNGYNSGYNGNNNGYNAYQGYQGSGCQQVLFQASGCVSTSTSSGGQSCAGQTLSAGQQCSNGVISCQTGVSCSGVNSGTSITHCPSTMTTPQCTASTTATTPAPTTTAAVAPQSGPTSCPGGGYAASAAACSAGTSTVSTLANTSGTGLAAPQTGFQVSLASGWNLISGPDGTTVPGAGLLTFQAGDTNYEQVAAGTPMKAGVGYLAFLPIATQLTLATAASAATTTVTLPAGQAVLIGNPGNTPATVTGADNVFMLTPGSSSYSNGTQLQPGQGAWAMSTNGGQATIANAPSSPSTSISAPGS